MRGKGHFRAQRLGGSQQGVPLALSSLVSADAQTVARLQEQIQAWLHLHSGLHISFCAERACQHLQSFEGASPHPMGVPSLTPL